MEKLKSFSRCGNHQQDTDISFDSAEAVFPTLGKAYMRPLCSTYQLMNEGCICDSYAGSPDNNGYGDNNLGEI